MNYLYTKNELRNVFASQGLFSGKLQCLYGSQEK